jgi:hypothetical protein
MNSLPLLLTGLLTGAALAAGHLESGFANPPMQYRSRPFYWLNAPLEEAELRTQIRAMRDECGFGGFSPLPMSLTRPKYLTEDYFRLYGVMLEEAEKLGLKVDFYDDVDYPAGTVGGVIAAKHPQHLMKNLRQAEREVAGGSTVEAAVPEGRLMAVVAMETTTKQRLNLAPLLEGDKLRWQAPDGRWKVMFFTCVPEGNVIDYLDPVAVDLFIDLTYGEYERRFGRHFGTTITRAFTDDVALYYTSGQRTWTYDFNTKFEKRHGMDPALLYPALWHDIGPETEAARVALFGFRAELFSEVFVRKLHEWCKARGVKTSGHPMGPFNLQPVDVSGDNLLFHRHMDLPTFDSIHYYGLGRPGFKLTSSAAANYDKPLTCVEIYGAYPDDTVDETMLYRSLMEVFARGANVIIPHGMWYDTGNVTCPPEISHRSAKLGPGLRDYNRYLARCSALLQGGRNVVDIGMLYPVKALHAAYSFEIPAAAGFGHEAGPKEADYLKISDRLTCDIRRDFTFLHPEVIDERCEVKGATLRLNNNTNWEEYRAIIIPGGKVISWSNLEKIEKFYENGGCVIGTSQLPEKSAEFGRDGDVQRAIARLFGQPPAKGTAPYQLKTNGKGGKTYFAEHPSTEALQAILDDALPVADVVFENTPRLRSGGGMLSYLHKVKDGADLYYFANSTNDRVDTWVRLRGKMTLQAWDPHSGAMTAADCKHETEKGQDITRVRLVLSPVKSVFLVGLP